MAKRKKIKVDNKTYNINSPEYKKLYSEGIMSVDAEGLPTYYSPEEATVTAKRINRGEEAVRKGRGKFGAGVLSALDYAMQFGDTPTALALEALTGRGDINAALPNITRSLKKFKLPVDESLKPYETDKDQLSVSEALGITNPYLATSIDMLSSRGVRRKSGKAVKNPKKFLNDLSVDKLPQQYQTSNQAGFANLFGLSKPKQNFKSEIDWGKWNPETPNYPELINEYNTIEESTKKAGTWMKNPNGSEFKGTPEQFIQQQSSWFKKAFGNSKLVNPDGSPTIQYHGSAKKFDTFDESKFQLGDSGYSGKGIYTTPDKDKASSYSLSSKSIHKDGNYEPTVYELYGQGNNPISAEDLIKQNKDYDLFNFHRAKDWRGDVPLEEQMLDYDVAIRNQTKGVERVLPWNQANELVFPTNKQLKSAIGNVGFFDMTNPNIYKGLAPGAIATGAALSQLPQEEKALGGTVDPPKKSKGYRLPTGEYVTGAVEVTAPKMSAYEKRVKAAGKRSKDYRNMGSQIVEGLDKAITRGTDTWYENLAEFTPGVGQALSVDDAYEAIKDLTRKNPNQSTFNNILDLLGPTPVGKYGNLFDASNAIKKGIENADDISGAYGVFKDLFQDQYLPNRPTVKSSKRENNIQRDNTYVDSFYIPQKANGGTITNNMKKKKNKNLPIDNGLPKAGLGLEMLIPLLGNIGAGTTGGLGTATGAGAGLQSLGSTAAGSVKGSTGGASVFGSSSGGMKSMNPLGPLATATTKAVTDMVKAIIEPEENYRTTLNNVGAHYATGGTIHIKPSKRGTFTAAAKKHGKSVQAFASQVLKNKDNYSPAMVKKANFARNASKWKHAMGGLVGPEIFGLGGYMDAFDYMALGGLTGGFGDPPSKTKLPTLNKELHTATAAELIGGPIQNFSNYDPADIPRIKLGYYKSGQEYLDAFNKLEDAYSTYGANTPEDRDRIKQENPQVFNPLYKSYNSAKFYQCPGCYGDANINPSGYKEYVHPKTGSKINIAEFERPILKRTTSLVNNMSADLPEEEFKIYNRLAGEGYGIDKRTNTFISDRKQYMDAYKSGNLEKMPFKKPSNETALVKHGYGGNVDDHPDYSDYMAMGGMIDPSMYMQQMMYGSYAQGGQVPQNIPVEVEGQEMYEMPNGETGEFKGPKHENGGIPIALPEGTKIYSDRLKVNGKTMAARKDKREANIAKLEKLLSKNPSDKFIKEALKRQQETASLEEQQDMQMQEQANQQQAQQEQAMEQMLMGAAQQDIQEGMMAMGGMIKRADGSYSQRGLWDNIRANAGSGKKPTKEMLAQEKKIKLAEKAYGGLVQYDGGTSIAGIPQTNYMYSTNVDPYYGLVQNPMLQSSMPTEFDVNTFGYNSYSPSYADAVLNNNIGNTYGVTAGIENTIPRTNMPEPINIEETSLRSTYPPTFESSVPAFTQKDSQKRKKPGFDLSGIFGNFGGSNTSGSDVRYTEGDRMGMMGNTIGTFGPAAMTMLNWLGTPKNKNFYNTFGQEALRTQMEAEGIAGMAKDEVNKKNKEKANALRKQLANSGRGVGDIKTGQLMAALAEQEGARDILGSYLQSMAGLKGQRAQLQQQIDQTRMGGEYQRDLANRQDFDKFMESLATDTTTIAEGLQKQGKDMNTALRNKHILQLSKYYSAYGVYPEIDEDGNFVLKDDSTGKTITEKEAREKKKKMDEEAKKAKGTTTSTTTTSEVKE